MRVVTRILKKTLSQCELKTILYKTDSVNDLQKRERCRI